MVRERAVSLDWSPAMRLQEDVEARWTQKHGKIVIFLKKPSRPSASIVDVKPQYLHQRLSSSSASQTCFGI